MAVSEGDLNEIIDGLGWGKFQAILVVLLGGLMMVDGMQMILASSLVNSIAKEYNGSRFDKGLLASAVFLGLMIGSIISGPVGDKYGRRFTCIVAYVMIVVFGLLCVAGISLDAQLLFRFMLGAGAGIGVPAVITLLVECAPTNLRSQLNNAMGFFFPLGEVWAAVGLIIFMPSLVGTEWRMVSVWGILPALVIFPFVAKYLCESPRWLALMNRKEELQDLLKDAAVKNDVPNLDITLNDSEAQSSSGDETGPSATQRFMMLFSDDLLHTTLICCFLTFLCNFMFYGQSYALAQAFQDMENDWTNPATEMLLASMFELPGFLLSMYFIQSEWFGHKDTISIFALTSGVLACFLITIDYDLAWISDPAAYLIKLLTAALFNITYVYIPEAYPSLVRQTACGFCISFGRLGSVFAPMLFESMGTAFGKSHIPFLLLCALMCAIGAWLSQELRVETKGMQLAVSKQEEIAIENSEVASKRTSKFLTERDLKWKPNLGETAPLMKK